MRELMAREVPAEPDSFIPGDRIAPSFVRREAVASTTLETR
jgi:hypothetical protein